MSEPTRGPRRRMALSVALLAALPGCLTEALWKGYGWPDPVVLEQVMERQTSTVAGTLVPLPRLEEYGLWLCDGEDCTSWRWWLRPQVGAGAEFAAALLADPDFCTVDAAVIDAVRSNVGEEVTTDEARLELDVRLRTEAIGEAVPAAEIPPAAAGTLATTRRNAYMLAEDPGAGLPAACRDCLERLPGIDLRRLVGAKTAVHAETWVFVDADGKPAFQDAAAAPASPRASPSAGSDDASLARRLDTLRDLSLLVRVRHGGDSTILRLRPDRLWLLSGLDVEGDRFVHRSTWHLQNEPVSLDARPAADAPRMPATLRLQESRYERSYRPVLIDSDFLARAALTPVTLALDVVFGPGLGDFLSWLIGGNRGGGDRQQRRQ